MIYLFACLLGLLAMVFVCWPLLRGQSAVDKVRHDDVVRGVYRTRVSELVNETEDEQLRAEIEQELGAVLLSEVQADQVRAAAAVNKAPLWIVALCLPLLGLGIFLTVADPSINELKGAEEVLRLSSDDDVALQSWQLKLRARTAAQPDDSKSWYLLAHTFLKQGQFKEAAEAFATTSHLAGDDLNIQVYWLQSRYLAANGILDEMSQNLAAKILEQQPNLPVVLEILALDAFRRGNAETAISMLNKGLSAANDLRQQASFASAIKQVRASITEPPPGVQVAVSADSSAAAHSTVFVIARPVGGGMPYAVVKRPAFLLPFEVSLDDLVAMSPARKLSEAEEFEVLVRLSASGNAMPSDGDWQWRSNKISRRDMGQVRLDAILTPPE